jgi:hypothetical protein
LGKYDPLRDYLRAQTLSEVTLTFKQIEKVLGTGLPINALKSKWWSNELSPSSSHAQRLAWADAGYDAFLYAGRKVRFKKVG